jgi:predicted alpha/beta-hydrolase family hydrolase
MALDLLWNRVASPVATLLLAHGAGGAMDSPWMTTMAGLLADRSIQVARFEFAYMAGRRSGVRKPPPRGDSLVGEFRDAVAAVSDRPLLIGGKSMGGRVASLVADELHAAGDVAGLVCLGYPFHPLGKPEQLRTAHLAALETPTIICQGTRDAFGTREEVADYSLSEAIELEWLEDGDHDLRPRKGVSGFTHAQHLATTSDAIAAFAVRLPR